MPWRRLLGGLPNWETLSYTASGAVTGGGLVMAQAAPPASAQTFYGMMTALIGLATLTLPYAFKALDRYWEQKGLSKKLAEAEAKLKDMQTRQVEPNTVHIAALDGKFAAVRDELVRSGFLKASPSTDAMPTIKPALLVEDDPGQARLMAEVLTTAGYEVRVAATLADAIASLSLSPPPALVLLDLGLPDGDGLDVVRAARRSGMMRSRFVVTTGYSGQARLDQAASYLTPRDALLVKPVDFHQLMAAVLPPREGDAP